MSSFIPLPVSEDWYAPDEHFRWLVRRSVGEDVWPAAEAALTEAGRLVPSRVEPLVRAADDHPPVLRPYAPNGDRVDEIDFHPAYRELERLEHGFGLVRMSNLGGWRGLRGPAPRTLGSALVYLFTQSDQALCACPVMMTDAMCWTLRRHDEALAARFVPRLASDRDDYMSGAMFLTEKAGGADVGANQTRAVRDEDGTWRLWGDKWFCSNAGADLALVLARPEGARAGSRGLGLFLLPRTLDDGSHNTYRINRLKDKFGTRMMASGEITLEGAAAWPVGELGQGFKQMMDMVDLTRVLIPTATAGVMRRVAFEALQYAAARRTFGKVLDTHPLMRDTLAELVVDASAGATAALLAAETFDAATGGDSDAARRLRIVTPLLKLHSTERARQVAADALEARGGNGYILDWPNARLLRDVSVHAIWEGPSNIMALDVLRTLRQGAAPALFAELERRAEAAAAGITAPLGPALLTHLRALQTRCAALAGADEDSQQLRSRRLARQLALATIAVTLADQARQFAEDTGSGRLAWIAARFASRLGGDVSAGALADDGGWLPHAPGLLHGGPVPLEVGRRAAELAAASLY